MGSREVRAVPAGWEHPKDKRGDYIPLKYRYDLHHAMYQEGVNAIKAGKVPSNSVISIMSNSPFKIPEWVEPSSTLAAGYTTTLEEWAEEYQPPEDFMIREADASTLTHYQMYETVSEGTPISPVFSSHLDLKEWVKNN